MTAKRLYNPTQVDSHFSQRAEQGDIQACNKLLCLANRSWVSGLCWTPIQFEAVNGFVKDFLRVLEQDFHSQQENGWTPLHWAAFDGQLEVVKVLIREFKTHVD